MIKADRVIIDFGDVRYCVQLTGKRTVVVGDSGTGKSLLAEKCENVANGMQQAKCIIKHSEHSEQMPKSIELLGMTSFDEDIYRKIVELDRTNNFGIVVLDEQVTFGGKRDTMREIYNLVIKSENPNLYFVLIGRQVAKRYMTGARDLMIVKSLTSDDGFNILSFQRYYYTNNNANIDSHVTPSEYCRIICEDKKSGFAAARLLLSERGYTNIQSAEGKDKIIKFFSEDNFESSIVIMDLCGNGSEYLDLLGKKHNGHKIFIVTTESFEWECLVCHGDIERDSAIDYSYILNIRNEEEYYTRLLDSSLILQTASQSSYRKDRHGMAAELKRNGYLDNAYPEIRSSGSLKSAKGISPMTLK